MSTVFTPNASESIQHFLETPIDTLLAPLSPEQQSQYLVALFQHCAAKVPAYAQYLEQHSIDSQAIQSYADFQNLPLMTKADYMQAYPLSARCVGGSLLGVDRIAVSSGSTGQPTFWPRSLAHELEVAVRFEQVLHDSFQAHTRSTLAIVCFALGNWVGGMFTTSCCWHLAHKGYPLLVATPGNNKAEIMRIVKALAPQFEQTVLLGYPPFVKDVIDAGMAEGITWADYQPKLVFAGEVFSEEWRSLLATRMGSAAPCFDFASLYGTADGGVLGNETPFSIAIRRWLATQPEAARTLFGESRLPTVVQFDPKSRYFEEHHGTLVVTGNNSVPLLRYHIADKGGVISFAAMWEFLNRYGILSYTDLGLPENFSPRELPFVFVFGRADFTVSFYGANIYPENISVGLEQAELTAWLTGKFVLESQTSEAGDAYLHISVELLPGVTVQEALIPQIAESIRTQLLRLNSEFANYTPTERQLPAIKLCLFGDPEYFPVGVKHRYTRKTP